MTSAQVVETSVTTTDNSPSQDYTHPDDQTTLLHATPGFKPFTGICLGNHMISRAILTLCARSKQPCTIKTIIYNDIFTSLRRKKSSKSA